MTARYARTVGIVTAAFLYVAAATAMAQDKVKIVDFYVDEIDVYADKDGLVKKASISKTEIKMPIEVLEMSPSYMMRVDSGKLKGWIYSTIVQTEGDQFERTDVGPCNHAVPDSYAALRNVGNQCGEQP